MAKSIIMHNPFEDIPDFRNKSNEKRELDLSIKGAYLENMSKNLIDKIDFS
jgi:hypothetical protein